MLLSADKIETSIISGARWYPTSLVLNPSFWTVGRNWNARGKSHTDMMRTLTNLPHKTPNSSKTQNFLATGTHANRRARPLLSDGIFYKWSIPQCYCTYLRSLSNLAATPETVNACSVSLKMDLQYVTYKHQLVFFRPCEKHTFSCTLTVPSYYIFTPWYSFTHSQQSLSDGRIEWAVFVGEWLCRMHRPWCRCVTMCVCQ